MIITNFFAGYAEFIVYPISYPAIPLTSKIDVLVFNWQIIKLGMYVSLSNWSQWVSNEIHFNCHHTWNSHVSFYLGWHVFVCGCVWVGVCVCVWGGGGGGGGLFVFSLFRFCIFYYSMHKCYKCYSMSIYELWSGVRLKSAHCSHNNPTYYLHTSSRWLIWTALVSQLNQSFCNRFAKQSYCIRFQAPALGSVHIRRRIAS